MLNSHHSSLSFNLNLNKELNHSKTCKSDKIVNEILKDINIT